MKTFHFIQALTFTGGLLFGGCSGEEVQQEKPYQVGEEAAPVVHYTEYFNYVLYKVTAVTEKGEVFGEALDGAEGLYLDKNDKGYKKGDIVRGTFDSLSWDFIEAEKANNVMVTLEDGREVNAYKYFSKETIKTEDGSKVSPSYYE